MSKEQLLGSPEAEEYVIGGIMKSPRSVLKLLEDYKVTSDWFDVPRWRYSYEAIQKLLIGSRVLEPASIANVGKKNKSVIGKASLENALKTCKDVRNVSYYLEIMQDKLTRRILAGMCHKINREITLDMPVEDIVGFAKTTLSTKLPHHHEAESVDEKLEQLGVSFRNAGETGTTGIPYRMHSLNELTAGKPRGKVIVVGARPKIGKTTFGLNDGLFVAKLGEPVGIIELEMLEMEIRQKMIADELGVDLFSFNQGKASEEEIKAFIECGKKHKELPLHLYDKPRTIENICMVIRDMADRVPYWIIDYMQRIKQSKFDPKSDRERYERYSNMITDVANETGATIMAICQLNRDAEFDFKGKRKRPEVKNLKGSGAFEQDGQQVILIGRDLSLTADVQLDEEQPTDVIVAYNRAGHTGTIKCTFQKNKQRIIETVEKGSE